MGADNCRVAVLHIILRYLTLVLFGFLGEKIHREAFLQKRIALIFFIGENALHR